MSRPIKQGLDYFPMDVDLDDKFELIEAKHGITGFGVIVKLYQRIYKEGYFLKWTDETALIFAKKIGVNIDEINAILEDCFKYNIFSKTVFSHHKVLTSVGIQARFCSAIQRRKEVNLCKSLLIIDISSLVNVYINWVNVDNSTQRKGKERRVKERREEEPENPSLPELNFIQLIVEEFTGAFPEYVITTPGKENAAAAKLLATFKKLYPELSSEEMLKKLRSHFDACKNIGDKWYRANMSLSLMVSKYNEINNHLNRPTQQRAGVSPDLRDVDTTNRLNEE